jgi:plasmid stabilization system protein ParE
VEEVTWQVLVHPRFERDLESAIQWYDERQPGLGARFEQEVARCMSAVQERPLMFAEVRGRLRQALVSRFPYIIVFQATETRVLVGGLFHGARDRGLWDERFGPVES